MFKKSGKKIRNVGEIVFAIQCIIGILIIIFGLIIGFGNFVIVFSHLVIGGIIIFWGWIISLFLIAFGDLADSNQRIVEILEQKFIEGEKKSTREEIYIITYYTGEKQSIKAKRLASFDEIAELASGKNKQKIHHIECERTGKIVYEGGSFSDFA